MANEFAEHKKKLEAAFRAEEELRNASDNERGERAQKLAAELRDYTSSWILRPEIIIAQAVVTVKHGGDVFTVGIEDDDTYTLNGSMDNSREEMLTEVLEFVEKE